MNDRTTDLETIRTQPHRFTWGRVVEVIDVGPFTIVEYLARHGKEGQFDDGPHAYHVYVGGKDTAIHCASFDGALIVAIARNRLGEPNRAAHMASAVCKLLDIRE